MEIYPITHRKGEIHRLVVNEIVTAVFLMAARAKKLGWRYKIITKGREAFYNKI